MFIKFLFVCFIPDKRVQAIGFACVSALFAFNVGCSFAGAVLYCKILEVIVILLCL